MKIRCRHCGEYFCPSDESVDLISEGYITSDNVNICDDYWDMMEHLQDDNSEMIIDLMHQYNVGVQIKASYEVKMLDDDFFEV